MLALDEGADGYVYLVLEWFCKGFVTDFLKLYKNELQFREIIFGDWIDDLCSCLKYLHKANLTSACLLGNDLDMLSLIGIHKDEDKKLILMLPSGLVPR